jgi:hypothetical protein
VELNKKDHMSQFQLTAKFDISFNGGMKIHKGQTFFVNLPFGRLPFDSINSKEAVTKRLELEGFNIKGRESILSSGYFDFKKL